MKTYTVIFQGYWREKHINRIPAKSGIYLVYRSVYNEKYNALGLREIIYIGQAENVNARLSAHEKLPNFKSLLLTGEELGFAFAPVPKANLDIVENSMIFAQKPVLNDQLKDTFNYDDAEFKIDGKCIGLNYTEYTITSE